MSTSHSHLLVGMEDLELFPDTRRGWELVVIWGVTGRYHTEVSLMVTGNLDSQGDLTVRFLTRVTDI